MINIAIIGASGYAGAQMCQLVDAHEQLNLTGLYVSEHSEDKFRDINEVHPKLLGLLSMPLQPLNNKSFEEICLSSDGVVLATSHEVSHDLAHHFVEAGLSVFDLSGAFRFKDSNFITSHYGFEHQYPSLLAQAVYGLAEWNRDGIKQSKLIAVPGCYPTASLLALKPLQESGLLDERQWPVINAVSGVTGAGRKAVMNNSFCEVSLSPYGVLTHRHQPEIVTQLGCDVIFTPHLGNFKRGILATIVVKLNKGVTEEQIKAAYCRYMSEKYIRLRGDQWPKVEDVVNTPFCDIAWKYDASSQHLVVTSAIDNLLKGAAGQGLQCIELHYGLEQ